MKRIYRLLILLSVSSFFLLNACTPDSGDDNNSTFNNKNNNNQINNNNNNATCTEGQQRCSNNAVQSCTGGQWVNTMVCGINGNPLVCDPTNLTCQDCISGGTTCGEDNNVHSCTNDGQVGLIVTECDSTKGEACVAAGGVAQCDSPCLRAAANKSYRGCDYWLVSMANPGLGSVWNGLSYDPQTAFDNDFGVVVDNSQNSAAASVSITSGSQTIVNDTVPAGELKVFLLPYNLSIRQAEGGTLGEHDSLKSGIYRASTSEGAFHLVSTLPVTVYQFNPYNYEKDSHNSYSNDASLILPTSVLSTNYLVMARPSLILFQDDTTRADQVPGLVTIVASEDNTVVTVKSSSYVISGPSVGALTPNDEIQYSLNKGDVLQLLSDSPQTATGNCAETHEYQAGSSAFFCNPTPNYDLTGTMVTSTKPVAVWGGHVCDFIPYYSAACDHLEEMMFPLETWGTHFFVGITHPVESGTTETNVIKILSGADGVQVSFNPAFENPATLNQGEYIEFMPEPGAHFEINATGPIMVGQFTVGQNYWTDSQEASGDPAFGLVVPVEQYRSEYTFTTPPSMVVNYVNVIAEIPTDNQGLIELDGQPITQSQYEPIGSTGYGVARIDVTNSGTGGAHKITAPDDNIKFGIEVYGFAPYTSYLYPGGLDLEYINPVGK